MNKTFEKLLSQTGSGPLTITIKDSETHEVCTLYTAQTIEEGELKLQIFDNETGEFYGTLSLDEFILKQINTI